MITIKSAPQIEKMRAAGALLHDVLQALRAAVQPGVTTLELDRLGRKAASARPAPSPRSRALKGFPSPSARPWTIRSCTALPRKTACREGQILSIDCGVILNGWQSDSALTVPVGQISPEAEKLIRDTEKCFWLGADQARAGNRLGDISHAVQAYAEAQGYGVIRDLCGHGIGEEMHEDPSIPNFGRPGRGVRLQPGMTLAIEPMICHGRLARVSLRQRLDGGHARRKPLLAL